jgi:16S rRNA (cytosine1402-N4)-methyltransferase
MNSTNNQHIPVLLKECVEQLLNEKDLNKNFYLLDGTLGGGGHTKAFLEASSHIFIIAFDYDKNAIEMAKKNFKNFIQEKRLELIHDNFKNISTEKFSNYFDGILLDLGYSSIQLAQSEYGLSFSEAKDSTLDMRLERPSDKPTAWDILVESTEDELSDIFYYYADIHNAKSLSKKIKKALLEKKLNNSTRSLAQFIEKITSHNKKKIHPATQVFQALRIAVNDELRNLAQFLNRAKLLLREHGRIAIITFHSIEDRLVKRWGQENMNDFKVITQKPIIPTKEEVQFNPRSRSAKLRVYERINNQ